jgi:hypothetical protein
MERLGNDAADVSLGAADTAAGALDLRTGGEADRVWFEVRDGDRQLAVAEGRREGRVVHLDRAEGVHGEPGDRAVQTLVERLHAQGLEFDAGRSGTTASTVDRRPIADEVMDAQDRERTADVRQYREAQGRPDASASLPDRYVEATPEDASHLAQLRAESKDPRHWIEAINVGTSPSDRVTRANNCVDCSMSVIDTLHGKPSTAAASDVCTSADLTRWAGRDLEPATLDEVAGRLRHEGDAAVLAAHFDEPPGHAFNAVNIDGKVRYVDGQNGTVADWPPPFAEDVTRLEVIYFDRHEVRQ